MYDKTKVKAFSSIRLKYLCDITTGNKDTKMQLLMEYIHFMLDPLL